jgi:hypothetical protein
MLASSATVECIRASAVTAAASCEDDSSAASFAASSTRDRGTFVMVETEVPILLAKTVALT